MKAFIELFVRRPVLATVVSLVILMLGLRSIQALTVRQYPETVAAVISITTPYPGADAELVRGFVTTPLEQVIASADGIDYMESSSVQGVSTIRAHLELDYDPNDAVAQILTKINQVRGQLPAASESPVVTVSTGEESAAMYLAFRSESLASNRLTDYLVRAVRPQLESIDGVQQAQILGGQAMAMRIWLDPRALAAHEVTASDVRQALLDNNVQSAVGETRGPSLSISLDANTSLHSAEEFESLVIRQEGNAPVRLRDVATVSLGAESYETSVFFDGQPAVFMAVQVLPTANLLDVAGRVRSVLPDIQRDLPPGVEGTVVYDATVFIEDSIDEVAQALIEALVIVTVVIFLFLGSLRAALVPSVAMPLSLVGAAFVMLMLGYSINLLTLLALVLAIGTVVDDGIVVVENVYRHMEQGVSPFEAALRGARELAAPIVAMNIVVLAVYAPVALMGGLTGTLFTEFAYTVAAATLISGIIALTLSPMMCSRLLKPEHRKARIARWVDAAFERTSRGYAAVLSHALDYRWAVLGIGAVVLASNYFLYVNAERELAPAEDQGFMMMSLTADPNTSIDRLERWTGRLGESLLGMPGAEHTFIVNGLGSSSSGFGGLALQPWNERERTTMQLQPQVQARAYQIAGLQAAIFPPPVLPGAGGGAPVQLVIGSTEEPLVVAETAQALLERVRRSGKFAYIDQNLKFDRLQTRIVVDHARAADLGISMADLGANLSALLSGAYVNYFSTAGRSYRVIPQVLREFRSAPEQVTDYHVRTGDGELVPVGTIARLEEDVRPRELTRFNQLNSATLSGVPAPGVSMGAAVEALRRAAESLPAGFTTTWAGESRQYLEEGAALLVAFALAVTLMYLVLAAQFESFRDPAIMLVSVPMSLAGALVFISLGVVTLNIYTQVALLALAASIIRHGILIVEFANQLQENEGLGLRAAVERAAAVRLRPILMTTLATLFGMVPLIFAAGPGAQSRFAVGFVLGAGMAMGTVFTVFVVPALYTVLARERRADRRAQTAFPTSEAPAAP